MPSPSFQGQVHAIIQTHCAVCHSPTGSNPTRELVTYQQISAQQGPMLTQSYACRMPPADAGVPLSLDERVALLGWLVCGAPNN
jgi:hypothetical protein